MVTVRLAHVDLTLLRTGHQTNDTEFMLTNGSSTGVPLSAAQSQAYEFLKAWSGRVPLLHLWARSGMGKTTVLQRWQRETNGHWVDPSQLIQKVAKLHPLAIEEGVIQVLTEAIEKHPLVIIDDFDHFYRHAQTCGEYIRSNYFDTVLKVMAARAASCNSQLVVGTEGGLPEGLSPMAWSHPIPDFQADDYRCILTQMTGQGSLDHDFNAIHRFASHMTCWPLQQVSRWLSQHPASSTTELLDFIQSQGMSSNVDTEEVQDVTLEDLIGADHIKEALEENIILPLENNELAIRFGLTPKRGIILAGPPGTGKTTVGRTLARRLKGKFFLIDGTMISGTDNFYYHVDRVFQQAVENAPSIVFIDDSDVIFESGREHGLYRYLLTKLDGLESKSASSVCVILTAMDLGNIPPALVRSGRIELWLETHLPNDAARRELLERLILGKVTIVDASSWQAIIEKTHGLSGADLKRVVQDAKLKMASDIVKQRSVANFEVYLLGAIDALVESRKAYVAAVKRTFAVNADRPRWFNVHPELFEPNTRVHSNGE